MDVVNEVLQKQNAGKDGDKSTEVKKDVEVEIDEGQLLVSDYNTFTLKPKTNWEPTLQSLTRGNVQLLINKIWNLPAKCVEEVVVTELPKPTYVLPRTRKVPKPKPLTKWQQFAKQKGITPKKKGKSKLKWDDMLQKWIPTYGFKRAEAEKQKEWIVECNEDGKPVEDPFKNIKSSKSERMAKNELQRLRNLAKAKKIKVPKVGLPSTEHYRDSKQLSVGAKVAEVSTASLGRFNETPKKDHKGVKGGKVQKKKKKKNPGRAGKVNESSSNKKPKGGKGNRDFRTKVGGRKRRK